MAQEIPIEELQKGVAALTWQRAVVSATAALASILIARLAGRFVRWAFARDEAPGPAFAYSKLLTYGLTFAGIVAAFGLLGMSTSSLVLTSSALLVGVGFSLQHVARDLVAGVVILVEQSIRQNDFVSFAGTTGTVREIGLRATQLLTPDGTVMVVPNHLLITAEVINHSHPFERSRLRVEVPADGAESADEARQVLAGVAARHPEVLADPPPTVRLEAIEQWGLRFQLIVWVKEAIAARRVASELRFAVSRRFAERGIQFPAQTVRLSAPARGDGEAHDREAGDREAGESETSEGEGPEPP